LEVLLMGHRWPDESLFSREVLQVLDRDCGCCREETRTKTYKRRPVYTLEGPIRLVSEITVCETEGCPGQGGLLRAEREVMIAPPLWVLGWDVFANLGQWRFAKHMSVSEIQEDLWETYDIKLSEDCIEDYIARYRAILAARQSDFELLRKDYASIQNVILTIDGLQPEKGHETLYTVREINANRVWFAVPLLSSSRDEVLKLFLRAKALAEKLGKPVTGLMSDKQDAFLTCAAEVFPDVPHRYCKNHFVRDLAKPVLDADSQAKVQMRTKVRNLRAIEKDILAKKEDGKELPKRDQAVLGYCAGVRGILNKNQGGPLDPPALQMAEGLKDLRASIQKSINTGKGGEPEKNLKRLADCIDRGIAAVADKLDKIPEYVDDIKSIYRTLDPATGKNARRKARFEKLRAELKVTDDPVRQEMGELMERWEAGLFVGGDSLNFLQDNLDLERWFRLPKSHQRKIHGRQHAGISIVHEGPSLVLALDAHHSHRRPFTEEELGPYLGAMPTAEECEAVERRKIMRRGASRQSRPGLCKNLEQSYVGSD
jgi:hypothetical protein